MTTLQKFAFVGALKSVPAYSPEQIEAGAKMLGFENSDLMLAYFKEKVLNGGLYEALRAKVAKKTPTVQPPYEPAQIAAMREWVCDCAANSEQLEAAKEATDAEIIRWVARNFDGGMSAFLATV